MSGDPVVTVGGWHMTHKPRPVRLWQEIALALTLKALVLAAIWAAFFSAPQDHSIDGQQAAAHLFSQVSQKEPNHDADTGTR